MIETDAVGEGRPVRSVTRALQILENFSERQRPATMSELAREIGMPISTCFSLVQTLTAHGYLYYLKPRGELYPTGRLGHLAEAISLQDPVLRRVQPILRGLRDRCGETVLFGKLLGSRVIYLDVAESNLDIRFSAHIGSSRQVHASSIGKALLAVLPRSRRDALLASIDYEKLTERTLRSREALEQSIEEGASRGWWSNVGESTADVMGVATARRMFDDYYGVAVVGPEYRFRSRLAGHASQLLEAAARLGVS